MNILEKMQHDKLIEQHVETLRGRYKAEGLSILELRQRFQALAEDSLNPEIEDSMRELYAQEYKLVQSLIEAAMPPIPKPDELLKQIKHTNPAAAEALQHQLDLEAKRDAVTKAKQTMDYATENKFDRNSDGYKRAIATLESAENALAFALATPPPHFQRQAEARLADQNAKSYREAAAAMEGSYADGNLETQARLNAQADSFDQVATELRHFNYSAPKTVEAATK
jgi:hypothetical protein